MSNLPSDIELRVVKQNKMEFFIDQVQRYPCIWDMCHMSYRDTIKKDVAWKRIAKECGLANGKEAKTQWKKLRDCHREALRRRKTPTGQILQNVRPWRYENAMKFILPQLENRAATADYSNNSQGSMGDALDADSNMYNTDSLNTADLSSSIPEVPASALSESYERNDQRSIDPGDFCEILLQRERRDQRQCERKEYRRRLVDVQRSPQDALKSLFDSFCQKTRELPRFLQLRVQREVFESITRAEEEAMNFEAKPYFSPASSASTCEYKNVPFLNEYTAANNASHSRDISPLPQASPTYASSPVPEDAT